MTLQVFSTTDILVSLSYGSGMGVNLINSNKIIGLKEFLSDSLSLVGECGAWPLLVLHENKPVFYVVPAKSWDALGIQMGHASGVNTSAVDLGVLEPGPSQVAEPKKALLRRPEPRVERVSDRQTFEKKNNLTALAEKLLDIEWERVARA